MCVPSSSTAPSITTLQQQRTASFSMLPINELVFADAPSIMKKTKKTVTFSESVKVMKHLHRNDYTAYELAFTWYNHAEQERIKSQIRLIAGNENAETRGLEFLTREGSQTRDQIKIAAYDAVMDEQDIQFEKGIYDEEKIATVYYAVTLENKIAARSMGALDAAAAKEDEEESSGLSAATTAKKLQQQQLSPPTFKSKFVVSSSAGVSCRA